MKRAKTILFIGNNYCSTIEDLRSTFESTNRSNYVGKEGKPLRKELLAYFKDGLLSNWLVEHGYGKTAKQLPTWKLFDDISDNELFKAIYKVIFERECTADLESAFLNMAELLSCEIDGEMIEVQNNKFFISNNAKEIRFTFKALEDIDSRVCFELVRVNGIPGHWKARSGLESYANGSEITISFSFQSLGINRKGSYVWKYVSNRKDTIFQMELDDNVHMVNCKDGSRVRLFRFINEKKEFWVTEPRHSPSSYYSGNEAAASAEKLLNELELKTQHKVRWARLNEIKTICEQSLKVFGKDYSTKMLPFLSGSFTKFYDGQSTVSNPKKFYFVAVWC